MANKDRPSGFRPLGPVRRTIEMTAGAEIFPGDAVALQTDGKVDPAAAGGDIFGIALSYASADGQKVSLSVDPDQLYVVQADGSDVDAQTDIGQNCDILATAGNSTYNESRQELDSSTIAGSSAQMTILGVDKEEGNALGAQVNVVVRINEHQVIGENDSAGV